MCKLHLLSQFLHISTYTCTILPWYFIKAFSYMAKDWQKYNFSYHRRKQPENLVPNYCKNVQQGRDTIAWHRILKITTTTNLTTNANNILINIHTNMSQAKNKVEQALFTSLSILVSPWPWPWYHITCAQHFKLKAWHGIYIIHLSDLIIRFWNNAVIFTNE